MGIPEGQASEGLDSLSNLKFLLMSSVVESACYVAGGASGIVLDFIESADGLTGYEDWA